MQRHILYSFCVVLMLGCIAHGENDIKQDHNKVVARAENLESHLIGFLFSDIKELRKEIKEQQAKREEDLRELKTKHKEEIGELKSSLQAANDDIAKLTGELEQLREELEDKPKTVYAQIQLLGQHILAAGARVKFTKTIANIGEAYKTAHGYFEAPYDGTYLFTANLCMKLKNYAEFRIVQDNDILSEGFSGEHDWHDCSSATAATYMQMGSKVLGSSTISHVGNQALAGLLFGSIMRFIW